MTTLTTLTGTPVTFPGQTSSAPPEVVAVAWQSGTVTVTNQGPATVLYWAPGSNPEHSAPTGTIAVGSSQNFTAPGGFIAANPASGGGGTTVSISGPGF